MLKHCSQSSSCVDVSRRSLRHNSFSLDSRLGASADMLDELSREQDYRSYCPAVGGFSTTGGFSSGGSFSGLVTLPRNRSCKPAALLSDSCLSLPAFSSVSAIKVYAQCLRPHLAYKTVMITRHTTSRQVVLGLLSRFRMKHRDPRLFYLTMEVNIGEDRSRTIALEDGSCLADLISCNPWGSCRFRLKARAGGLVRIHDGAVRTDSVYKSIILSADTTVEDTVGILGGCYSAENGTGLQLFEVDTHTGEERLLAGTEKPLEILEEWGKDGGKVFQLRRTREEVGENSSSPPPCEPRLSVEPFSRSLVRNSVLRQSIRKKQFFKSMICERSLNCEELGDELELEPKQFFSLGRFRLSDQIISETGEDPEDGGSDLENTSEGDLNCSTSGVSSLSCSSLDSEGVQENRSFYT